MAYTSGDLILDDHYNTFATGSATGAATDSANVNNLWGAGYGDRGYGQTSTVASVSAGTTITATQWATLLSRISTMAAHQDTSITSITNPTVGDTITAYTALSGNITDIYNNRLSRASTGTVTSDSATATASWTSSTVFTLTFDFGTADEARYFFNGGGYLTIDPSISGGTSDSKYDEWVDLVGTLCGTVVFGAQGTSISGGTGTADTIASSTGYYDLSSTYTTIYKQFADSSPYTSNYFRVQAKVSGTAANGGPGSSVVFEVRFQDDEIDGTSYDKSVYNDQDTMNGTIQIDYSSVEPNTTYLSNVWGGAPTASTSSSQA